MKKKLVFILGLVLMALSCVSTPEKTAYEVYVDRIDFTVTNYYIDIDNLKLKLDESASVQELINQLDLIIKNLYDYYYIYNEIEGDETISDDEYDLLLTKLEENIESMLTAIFNDDVNAPFYIAVVRITDEGSEEEIKSASEIFENFANIINESSY